jgi:hypothetical protein
VNIVFIAIRLWNIGKRIIAVCTLRKSTIGTDAKISSGQRKAVKNETDN